ncbi:hypothetical protein BX600DRAFT_481626 [Xylariales sp. PMI_506]|nr:hypothetical protein BX600DRAFT_481626 [Xylariales sp. PMI_506]
MSTPKTILVTGCSDNSLGSALAIALHNKGWRVFASARNPEKLTVVKEAGIECVIMDVASEESISAAVKEVEQKTGGSLDGLLNNAGGGYSMPIIHIELNKLRDLFDINVYSLITVTRACLPLLLKSKRNPLIANNTSASGLFGCGVPFQYGYSATKAAATALTEGMRIELAPFGIRVVNIVTGGAKSAFFDNANDAELPEDSIYNIAKEVIEAPMNGNQPGMSKMDATTYAERVAKDLSQSKPPFMMYRGTMASTARLGSMLPIGAMDGLVKKMSGIDELEKKIRAQGGLDSIRDSL